MTNAKQLPSSVVRQQWREILDSMLEGGPDVVVLRYEKPMAVIIPFRDYRAINDLLDEVRKTRNINTSS